MNNSRFRITSARMRDVCFAMTCVVAGSVTLTRTVADADDSPVAAKQAPHGEVAPEAESREPNRTETGAKAREVSSRASSPRTEFPAPDRQTLTALLTLHNDAREEQGLTGFQLDPRLTAAAQRYAEFAYRSGSFGHTADGRSPGDRIAAEGLRFQSWAENMAWGQRTPEQAMGTWLHSELHQANILSHHSHVGFGRAGNVWVSVFANLVEGRR